MSMCLQSRPTSALRLICQKIQAETARILNSSNDTQQQTQFTGQQTRDKQAITGNQKKLDNGGIISKHSQSIFQEIKNHFIRIVWSQLPQIVSYQQTINDTLERYQSEIQECKKQTKTQKHKYQSSILEIDNLKLEILEFENQNQQLSQEIQSFKYKYDEAMTLVGKCTRQVQKLQAQKQREQAQQQKIQAQKVQLYNFIQQKQQKYIGKQDIPVMNYVSSQKSLSLPRQMNFPLQIRQKLNEAENVLSRSPRSRDPHLQSSRFQLSSEIVGCQKQLLQIQLRQSQRQITELRSELQQQRVHVAKLQDQVYNLQKQLNGEMQLNEKLDKQVYILIKRTKQMKIQLLQERARANKLLAQILQLEQNATSQSNIQIQLQARIIQLQAESKRLIVLQQRNDQLASQLQISQEKYGQLRRIKQQFQENVGQFQTKLSQLQRKQSSQQLLTQQFHQTMKSQNSHKIRQIQGMSLTIRTKYQKKIQIIQKQYKQLRQKYKQLKQDNSRLYDAVERQVKKQVKLQDKFKNKKQKLLEIQNENVDIKKDKQLSDEKLRTQKLLNRQLKTELVIAHNGKQQLQIKLQRLHSCTLPHLINEIAKVRDQLLKVKSLVSNSGQLYSKIVRAFQNQYQSKLFDLFNQGQLKFEQLQKDYNKELTLFQHFRKQSNERQECKARLTNRFNEMEKEKNSKQEEIQERNQQMKNLEGNLTNSREMNIKLQKQVQNIRRIQRCSLEQIQILREKQKQVQKFYDLVAELTHENQKLKQKLARYYQHQQQYVYTGSKKQLSKAYLLPSKQQRNRPQKYPDFPTSTHNSHSCVHFRPPISYNNTSSMVQLFDNQKVQAKPPSMQRKRPYPQSYKYKLHNQYIPPLNNQLLLNNSLSHSHQLNEQVKNDFEQRQNNNQHKTRHEFENQKQRLEEIKQEYQRMLGNQFGQELGERKFGDKVIN